jgi:hypothetical protein
VARYLFKEQMVRMSGSGGAAVDAEALEDLFDVVLDGLHAAFQDGSDLAIGPALSDPMQHLSLTLGERQSFLEWSYGRLWRFGSGGQASFS